MNVLTLAVTILMLVAIMTYARLETFLNTRGFELEYQSYMQYEQRQPYNKQQQDNYASVHGGEIDKAEDPTPTPTQEKSSDDNDIEPDKNENLNRFLNVTGLINPKLRADHPKDYQQLQELTIKLMDILYRPQQAFEELYVKYPDLSHRILSELAASTEYLQKNINDKKALANLSLQTPEIHEAFYRMLKGTAKKNGDKDGYPSLLNYIAVSQSSKPISIFLAPRELLIAIYGNETAQEIMQTRSALSRAIRNKTMSPQEAQNILERRFQGRHLVDLDPKFLSFATSKTIPPK